MTGVLRRVLVVGAGLAGLRTVQGLRRAGFDGEVELIGDEPHMPYDRPPLSKQVLLGDWEPARTALVTPAQVDRLGVTLRTGETAAGLDVLGHRVRLASGEHVPYDALVVATGAIPRDRPLPASGLAGVHDLRRIEDAEALVSTFDGGARVAIIGAGFIGTEVASASRRRGLGVSVVDLSPAPLVDALGEVGSAALLGLHRAHGVDLRLGRRVVALHGTGRVEAVELDDGARLPADVVVVGVGVSPASGWLRETGLDVSRGIPADATGATALPDVWAVGDVAAWPSIGGCHARPQEHWTSAVEQATVVAANLLRPPEQRSPHQPLPYVWTDHYGTRFQLVGEHLPGNEIRVVHGSVDALEFLALSCREGRVTGTLSVGLPRLLPRLKAAVRGGVSAVEFARSL